ncbi:hypothetical protein L6V77_35245 [Myxococcota bacterium]|nr:hypothetical protein [Myxococcota bacterium]
MSSTELAFVRNRLINGRFDDRDRDVLSKVRAAVTAGRSTFGPMIVDALDAAVAAAENGDTPRAGWEVNLVHNLPVSRDEEDRWDEAHFLRFELPSYLDQDIEAHRIRQVILAVADALRGLASG